MEKKIEKKRIFHAIIRTLISIAYLVVITIIIYYAQKLTK